jgi:hypothetical protein
MTKKARELFTESMQAAAKGRLAEARAAILGAEALSPHYSNLCILGDVELRLEMHVDAATHMRTCTEGLKADPKAMDLERQAASTVFDKAKERVLEIAIVAPADAAAPPKVAASLDGAALGTVPPTLVVFAPAGKHTVKLEADGYDTEQIEVEGAGGARKEVKPALKKTASVPTATASATATAAPSATVLSPPVGPRTELVIGGAAVAGVALIVGGVLVGVAESKRSELRADTPKNADGSLVCSKATAPGTADPACDELRQRMRAGNALGQVGVGLFVAGGLIGLATVGYALIPRQRQRATSQLVPVVTSSGGGLLWTGSF